MDEETSVDGFIYLSHDTGYKLEMSGDRSRNYIMEENDRSIPLQVEQDDLGNTMQMQLDIYKKEHEFLKGELQELLAENQNLTIRLNSEFKKKLRDDGKTGLPSVIENEIIINLKDQLDMCKKEKEKGHELYQTCLKVIEKLENEIRFYQENRNRKELTDSIPAMSILEAKLKNTKEHLEMEAAAREQLESENIKHQTEIAKLKINVDANSEIIEEMKNREREWKEKCLKLEQEYALLNATFDCVAKSRNDLEKKIEIYGNKIQELIQSNNEAKNKVEEALDIVEKAIMERDAGSMREAQLQEEVNKLQLCLQHVIEEAGKKVGTEVEEVKRKYDINMQEILKDVPDLKSELQRKNQELKRITTKYKRLEKACSAKLEKEKISLIKGSETELTILESQLDSVYKELESLKLSYENLSSEKKELEDKYSHLEENYKALLSEKEIEGSQLNRQIINLKSQMEKKIVDLDESAKRSEYFVNQIQELQCENKELLKAAGKCNCEKFKMKLKKINESRLIQMNELEGHVESQMKLNEKWRKEIKEITEKFEEKIREVKMECARLKAKNKKIGSELAAANDKIASLQE